MIGTSTQNPPNGKRLTTGTESTTNYGHVNADSTYMYWTDTSDGVGHTSWEAPFPYLGAGTIQDSPFHADWINVFDHIHYYGNTGGC